MRRSEGREFTGSDLKAGNLREVDNFDDGLIVLLDTWRTTLASSARQRPCSRRSRTRCRPPRSNRQICVRVGLPLLSLRVGSRRPAVLLHHTVLRGHHVKYRRSCRASHHARLVQDFSCEARRALHPHARRIPARRARIPPRGGPYQLGETALKEISLQGYSREAGLERRYNGLILAAQAVCLIIMYVSHSSGYIAI